MAAILASLLGWATPSSANLTGSTFDAADANLVLDDEALDWVNAPNISKGIEAHTGALDDSFGQGSKEDTPVPAVVDGSIPPNKSDLIRFYVGHNQSNTGDTYLYLAWERVQDPSGTTNMDFELNQSSTVSANGVTPVRTAGDVLIKYDLSQGGSNPTMGFHKWVTTGSSSQCEAASKVPCWDKLHAVTAGAGFEASINGGSVTDPVSPDARRTLDARTFGEAAVNLTVAGILPAVVGGGTPACTGFASAFLKSRSSDSFTAAMKDFIAPTNVSINNCGTVNIHKVDDASNVLGGATFTLYTDSAPVGGSRGVEDTATSMTCTTSASTGDCSIANVPFGDYWAVETTTPSGFSTAADQHVTLSSATTSVSLSFTDNRLTSHIDIVKVDDDDPANPVAGATFTAYVDVTPFGGTRDANDTVSAGTCNTGAAGTCSITSLFLGHYWVVETVTPSGYTTAAAQATELTAATAGTGIGTGVTLNFVDPREFKVIVIVCKEGANPSLYQTPITVDGQSAGNSIATAPANTTEAAICGIAGGARGDLNQGSHSATAVIPQ